MGFEDTWAIVEEQTYPYLKWQDNYGFKVTIAPDGPKKPAGLLK